MYDTVGCMYSEFVFPKLLCGVLNIVRMLRIISTVNFLNSQISIIACANPLNNSYVLD